MNLSIIASSDGKKFAYSAKAMQTIVEAFKGDEVLVTFEKHSHSRTMRQLGYYFAGVVSGSAKYFGWSEEDMHAYLKEKCNQKQIVNTKTGEIILIAASTQNMTKAEYSGYIDRCIMHLAEHGYVVETPDEYYARLEAEYQQSQKGAK